MNWFFDFLNWLDPDGYWFRPFRTMECPFCFGQALFVDGQCELCEAMINDTRYVQ